MDKKQKKKTLLAVCFILICGTVYVGIRFHTGNRDDIVLVKQEEAAANRAGTEEEENTTNSEPDAVTDETVTTTEPDFVQEVYVHLCGAVAKEGVYLLPKGSRLIDGVTAAGGFTEEADTTYHNLAAELSDGQKVYVPTLTETEALSVTERTEKAGDLFGVDASETVSNGQVNINTASKEELMTLSGIGEAKAESILLYRQKVGPFQSIEELKHVSGIGDAMFERIKDEIVTE
ncbi:MAG: helix-hairpin-helix domain-containing protein [Lachnospiraceae bacterium]|nr:helix-hairpin-helix domain-containing protein [Lachnospiraceae bacterium]